MHLQLVKYLELKLKKMDNSKYLIDQNFKRIFNGDFQEISYYYFPEGKLSVDWKIFQAFKLLEAPRFEFYCSNKRDYK